MRSPITKQTQLLTCPGLPLGVYREVAAHLRQVEGVDAKPIMHSIEPDPTAEFDYAQSQVAALQIDFAETVADVEKKRVESILDYYARRYRPWKVRDYSALDGRSLL